MNEFYETYIDENGVVQRIYSPTHNSGIGVIICNNFDKIKVKRVIFNNQATIVFWEDGEKTVVKCHECDDGSCRYDRGRGLCDVGNLVSGIARRQFCVTHFDGEKAIMAAMLKRLYPNYQKVLRDALGK